MADNAGGRRSVVNPEVIAPARRSKSSLDVTGAVLAPVFCKTKKDNIDQEAGV